MKKAQSLTIVLPDTCADLPVQILRATSETELVFDTTPSEKDSYDYGEPNEQKYAFIWRKDDYLKVALDEILWIEADGSYSHIHLTGNRKQTVSFCLAVISKKLPARHFVRIHRSHIVNIKKVESLKGNNLLVDGKPLPIGRGYKDALLDSFIFLELRRTP